MSVGILVHIYFIEFIFFVFNFKTQFYTYFSFGSVGELRVIDRRIKKNSIK